MDVAAQGQHGPVANRHRPGIFKRGSLIENEIVLGERGFIDTLQRDRLSRPHCDHRISSRILAHVGLHISEAREIGIADQVNLIRSSIEAVDRVMSDRLREHQQVLAARCREKIVARPGENRRAL